MSECTFCDSVYGIRLWDVESNGETNEVELCGSCVNELRNIGVTTKRVEPHEDEEPKEKDKDSELPESLQRHKDEYYDRLHEDET